MKRSIAFVAFLVIGVIVGFSGNEVWRDRSAQSAAASPWIRFMQKHEDVSHDFIIKSDAALRAATGKPGTWNSVEMISKNLEAQLRIEELIIKSREAQHSRFTVVYLPWLALGGALVVALIAALFADR